MYVIRVHVCKFTSCPFVESWTLKKKKKKKDECQKSGENNN